MPDLKLLVLSARDVHELLPYGECADLVAGALAALARGEVYQPLRTVMQPPGRGGSSPPGLMALMPAIRAGGGGPDPDAAYGLKAICIFPGNPGLGKDAHQGVVLLSSPDTGEPQALINASADSDLVVVGNRGGGGFSRLSLGAVASQVVHHAHCPVVVVPSAE